MYGGEDFGFLFAFKIYMIRNPKNFIFLSIILTMPFFSFIIKVSERPIQEIIQNPQLLNWDDLIWFCIITTSTSNFFILTYSWLW